MFCTINTASLEVAGGAVAFTISCLAERDSVCYNKVYNEAATNRSFYVRNIMRKRKGVMKIIFILIATVLILLFIIYINHQIRLKKETDLRLPLGQMVEVDGHNMSVYVEGAGDATLVFMSGGGTCSPILDFKSLYSLLSDTYQIVVVEKFGYGFSDVVDKSRDIDSILEDTRTALAAAGLHAPYVLCPSLHVRAGSSLLDAEISGRGIRYYRTGYGSSGVL